MKIPNNNSNSCSNSNSNVDNNDCSNGYYSPEPVFNHTNGAILPGLAHLTIGEGSREHNGQPSNQNDTSGITSCHNGNIHDVEKGENSLLVPRTPHRLSREELDRRHRSVHIPFSFPPTASSEVIRELKGEELAAHIQNLADQTLIQQQHQQQPLEHKHSKVHFRPTRKSGRLEAEKFFLEETTKEMGDDYFVGEREPKTPGDNFYSLQSILSQWIDHSKFSLPNIGDSSSYATKDKADYEGMEKLPSKVSEMSVLVRQHLVQVENRLFEMFGDKEKQTININRFLVGLMATGLRHNDPRLKETRKNLKQVQEKLAASDPQALDVDYDTFMGIISENLEIVVKAFSSSFVIPDFRGFCQIIDEIYGSCQTNTSGKVASYIPQLARSNPEHWGVSICTVDGQRYSLGDVNVPFTVQSCSYALSYALALGELEAGNYHSHVGMEPSGRYYNELCLDYNNKPHNPMINAGAIMTAALIKPELSAADRFDYVFNMYKRLVAGEYLGFNNAVFLSERECADRNFALAYFMRENKCFPENTRLHETLDFYFQLCSLEITAESGSIIAATLANGGINPLTGDPVLTVEAVRNTLTLMHSCGMYNYSGQFAFKVGLPSKSGVSGCVLVVVPNTMGICLWSPPLDSNGNSCRSVQFCMELVSRFTFHNFDNLRGHISTKSDPRMARAESKAQILFDLLFSAAAGDLSALRRHSLSGTDMEAKDYDGRTALHVAASEGHCNIVEYLLKNCQVNPLPKDRWDRTPLDDSRSFGHPRCATLIEESCSKRGIGFPLPIEEVEEPKKEVD